MLENVEFYGEADKINGKIGSEYPAWYFKGQVEDLEEQVNKAEGQLRAGIKDDRMKTVLREDARMAQEKLDKINASRPELTDKDKDELVKASDDLGKKIKEMLFTRSQEQKGLADARTVYERAHMPSVRLNEAQITIAKKLGIRINNEGMVTGNDANRIWKIARAATGQSSNVEMLRRD